jgi:hypothetical protein
MGVFLMEAFRLIKVIINLFNENAAYSGDGWINVGLSKFYTNIFDNWDEKSFLLKEVILLSLAVRGKLQALKLESLIY